MTEFFSSSGRSADYYSDGAPSIDFGYWAQKLSGGRSNEVKIFSEDVFLRQVRDHLDEHEELGLEAREDRAAKMALIALIHERRELTEAESKALFDSFAAAQDRAALERHSLGGVHSRTWQRANADYQSALHALWSTDGLSDEQIDDLTEHHRYHEIGDEDFPAADPASRIEEIVDEASSYAGSNEMAHIWLQGQEDLFGSDTWEWDLRDYDVHFLYTCYAIDLSMRLYREHVERHGANDTYVLVREGRVDNRPAQPVIDLSFLDYGTTAEQAEEAGSARELIMSTPQAREELPGAIRELTELVLDHGSDTARERLNRALESEARVREHAANRSEQQALYQRAREERDAARHAAK